MTTHDDIYDIPQLEVLSQRLNTGTLCVLGRTIAGWLNRSRQLRGSAEVNRRLPRDNGLTHSVAQSEAAKPFGARGKHEGAEEPNRRRKSCITVRIPLG